MFSKILKQIIRHKLITLVILLLIIGGGYFGYQNLTKNKNLVRYVTATVEKGTLIVSVSGSGQVSAADQIDVKSKISSDVIYVGVENGQEVKAGTLLVRLDTEDAQKTIEDAEINLQQAELDLEKMKGIKTDSGTIRGVKEKAADDLEKAYEDGFNNVANIFLELPNIMTGFHDILFSYSYSTGQQNINYYSDVAKNYDEKVLQYQADAYDKYQTARAAYDKNFEDYKSASRFSEKETIESLISQTYETTKDIAEAIKSANNLIQFYQDKLTERGLNSQTLSTTHLSNLSTYTGKTNTYLLNLLSAKNTIQTDKETFIETDFDIADQETKVKQAGDTLKDAQKKLADYSIVSPFSGVVTEINVKKGDSVSSGTVIATLITKQKIAEITLNEIDVAKVKVGQKANIAFDAVEDLNITGEVAEVDAVGTVTQGVVSYGVKIAFDAEDERVKPGMSVSADIITDAKQNVLVLPNSAVKSQEDFNYVELVEASEEIKQKLSANAASGISLPTAPKTQIVEVGLSNDTYTEVVSGLEEGDIVVTSTVNQNKTQTATTKNQGSQGFGAPAGEVQMFFR